MPDDRIELGRGRLLLDLGFRHAPGLVACYLIPDPDGRWILVETGPTTCRESLLAGLRRAGIAPREVSKIVVTHIHLDHAGGLGAIASDFPDAALLVHESGVPHLIDPTRLIESARRAWGPASDTLWGPILPVPSDRVVPLRGGEEIPVREGTLRVIYTPGHARHHVALYDGGSGAVMTGDALGVRLPGSWRPRPAIPPPDLDIEALLESVERMKDVSPRAVWYTHFGPSPDGPIDFDRYRDAVKSWEAAALGAARSDPAISSVATSLRETEEREAVAAGHRAAVEDRGEMVSGYEMAAQGLLRYFRKRGWVSG